jgi:hypothetical protein
MRDTLRLLDEQQVQVILRRGRELQVRLPHVVTLSRRCVHQQCIGLLLFALIHLALLSFLCVVLPALHFRAFVLVHLALLSFLWVVLPALNFRSALLLSPRSLPR